MKISPILFIISIIIISTSPLRSYGSSIEKEKTLAMIKPDGVSGNYTETIKKMILESNFSILREKTLQLDEDSDGLFYAEHSRRGFFNRLIKYMTRYVNRFHSKLILGFNILFLPERYHAIQQEDDAAEDKNRVEAADSCSEEALLHEGVSLIHQDYEFFEKEKLRNTDEYKKILKCLYLYSKEIISRDELVSIVGDLLQYHGFGIALN